jgi:anthranilate phosphoribosyltransferase
MEATLKKLYGGEDLSFDETRKVLGAIMAGGMEHDDIARILLALKEKGETPSEIAGAARALQDAALPVKCDRRPLLDTCGTGGDGSGSINISTTAAIALAASGVAVAKHGNRAISSKSGSADVLEALGVKLDLEPASNEKLLEELGIAFMFAPRYHRAMKEVMPVRQKLATKTIFNIIGPLSNPARPSAQVLGVSTEDLLLPMAQALRDMKLERAFVVHGAGMDELGLHGTNRIVKLEGGKLYELDLAPADLGVEPIDPAELAGGDAETNAAILREIIGGRDTGARAQAVAINVGAGLILAGHEKGWSAAYERSMDILASGAAEGLLKRWAEASKDLS